MHPSIHIINNVQYIAESRLIIYLVYSIEDYYNVDRLLSSLKPNGWGVDCVRIFSRWLFLHEKGGLEVTKFVTFLKIHFELSENQFSRPIGR